MSAENGLAHNGVQRFKDGGLYTCIKFGCCPRNQGLKGAGPNGPKNSSGKTKSAGSYGWWLRRMGVMAR